MSVSKRAAKRQAVKEARRLRKRTGKPVFPKGHDKSGSKKRSIVYYSDASAELLRGHPNAWPGLEFRPK